MLRSIHLHHGVSVFIIAAVFLSISLTAFSGCSGRSAEKPELTIALAIFPNEAALYRRFLARFERDDGVRVNLIAQTYPDILRVLRAEAGAGRGNLDLVELDLATLGEARNDVQSLSALVTPSARALFPTAAWRAATFSGDIRFVPHRLMWQAMIYNHREVPRPPATWQQLLAFARAHPGRVALKGARYEGAVCDVMPFLWSAGGGELIPLAPGSLRAFAFLGALAPYLNPESPVLREMSALEAQARGEVWIQFNWPFAMSYLKSKGLAPNVDRSAPIPAGPSGTATVLGGGYLAIPRSAPHPRLAREFLSYLLTPAAQRRLSSTLGWYGSVAPTPGGAQAALYAGFSAMRPYVHARPELECYASLSGRWQRAIRELLFGRTAPAAALSFVAAGLTTPAHGAPTIRNCGCDRRETLER